MQPVIGKYIILIGAALLCIGLLVYFFGDKLNWPSLDWPGLDWLGRLPGDIRIEGKNGDGFSFSRRDLPDRESIAKRSH